jgi:hypothetical protein
MVRGFRLRLLPAVSLICAVLSAPAFADGSHDRTQVGRDIMVGPNEAVSEATCFGCSIRVRGQVEGDVVSFGGSVVVEDQGKVGGDATVFGGGLRLDKNVSVGGDVAVFGGRLRRDPTASIGGDVNDFGGAGWMILIFAVPLFFVGVFVALIVWIIRLVSRQSVPAAT